MIKVRIYERQETGDVAVRVIRRNGPGDREQVVSIVNGILTWKPVDDSVESSPLAVIDGEHLLDIYESLRLICEKKGIRTSVEAQRDGIIEAQKNEIAWLRGQVERFLTPVPLDPVLKEGRR